MEENFDFDNLFGDDPELSALLKSVMTEAKETPPANPAGPTSNPTAQPDTSGVLDPNELFKSASQNVQPVQSPDTYMARSPEPPHPQAAYGYEQPPSAPAQPAESPDLMELLVSLGPPEPNAVQSQPRLAYDTAGYQAAPLYNAPEQPAPPPDSGTLPIVTQDDTKKSGSRQKETEKPRTLTKKLLSIVSNLVFWLVVVSLIGGSLLFAFSNDPKKSYFGYRFYSVLTKSMTAKADGSSPPGGFNQGDIIIVKLCNPEDIKAGDIITFCPSINKPNSTAYLTHRVVEVLDGLDNHEGIFFRTRGDYNNADDPPINGAQLIGKKVAVIPKMGAILDSLRANFILGIIALLCLFGCIFMFKWYFKKPKEEEQQKQ